MEKREFPHEELIHVLLSNFFIENVIMFYATLTFNSVVWLLLLVKKPDAVVPGDRICVEKHES